MAAEFPERTCMLASCTMLSALPSSLARYNRSSLPTSVHQRLRQLLERPERGSLKSHPWYS
eukprot:scaffold13466_cov28-Tisochrysis_lutea.AAC.1